MLKTAMREWVVDVKMLVVRSVVAVPVIVAHMWRVIHPFCLCSSSLLKFCALAFGGAGGMRP